MRTRRTTLAAGFAVCLLAGPAACGTAGEPTSTPVSEQRPTEQQSSAEQGRKRPAVDASAVHRRSEYDYEMLSLAELVEKRPVVVLGEVVGWTNGRTSVESGKGYEYTSLYGVLEIEVTTAYRTSEGYESDHLFVEVPRGGKEHDAGEPDDTEPVLSTIDELNNAIPAGTRVILAGGAAPTEQEWEEQAPGDDVEDTTNKAVEAADLLRPDVQGLIFENENGDFVSGRTHDQDQWNWVPDTESAGNGFDYLVDELDKLKE